MGILPFTLPLVGFLLGSIPFGLFIAKAKGVDIRSQGSGNIGATNVLRVIGKKEGIFCLLLDILKGAIPVLLAVNILGIAGKDPLTQFNFMEGLRTVFLEDKRTFIQTIHVITGFCAIIGHNYSPWIGFKGGKGIATSAGVILALMPVGFLIVMVIWVLITFTTRYVAVGSVGAAIALPLVTFWGANHHMVNKADPESLSLWEAGTYNKPLFIFTIVAGVLAVWKHRSNMQRLLKGTENRFGKKK